MTQFEMRGKTNLQKGGLTPPPPEKCFNLSYFSNLCNYTCIVLIPFKAAITTNSDSNWVPIFNLKL